MTLIGTTVHVTPEGGSRVLTSDAAAHALDPSTQCTAEYAFIIRDPVSLTINQGDSSINYNDGDATGKANITSVVKTPDSGTSGDQTFIITVSFNTASFVKGDNLANKVKVNVTVTDEHGQTRDFSLEQRWYVWNYETIDLTGD